MLLLWHPVNVLIHSFHNNSQRLLLRDSQEIFLLDQDLQRDVGNVSHWLACWCHDPVDAMSVHAYSSWWLKDNFFSTARWHCVLGQKILHNSMLIFITISFHFVLAADCCCCCFGFSFFFQTGTCFCILMQNTYSAKDVLLLWFTIGEKPYLRCFIYNHYFLKVTCSLRLETSINTI